MKRRLFTNAFFLLPLHLSRHPLDCVCFLLVFSLRLAACRKHPLRDACQPLINAVREVQRSKWLHIKNKLAKHDVEKGSLSNCNVRDLTPTRDELNGFLVNWTGLGNCFQKIEDIVWFTIAGNWWFSNFKGEYDSWGTRWMGWGRVEWVFVGSGGEGLGNSFQKIYDIVWSKPTLKVHRH